MKLQIRLRVAAAALAVLLHSTGPSTASGQEQTPVTGSNDNIALHYSDGSQTSFGLKAVNERLMTIGVRVSRVAIPDAAKPTLKRSTRQALTQEESEQLIRHFRLGRRELLEEIRKAGRDPEMHRGGYLQTSEPGVSPYPKVYDMRSLDSATTRFLQRKFGKLHVNSSEAGVGIDEVMTIVSGGPYTWFFVLEDNLVGKLRFGKVGEEAQAWRISYPGLVPHGGYFDAQHGLVVAYAHGPKSFIMRYEDESVRGYETLGGNPWIDFSGEEPVLLDELKQGGGRLHSQLPADLPIGTRVTGRTESASAHSSGGR